MPDDLGKVYGLTENVGAGDVLAWQGVTKYSEHGMLDLMNKPGDRANWSRHEIKYVISEAKAAAMAAFIRPYMGLDRFNEFQEDRSYAIVSLYFDSDDLRLCRETQEGIKDRFKLRIRRYSDDPEFPSFFEIKYRMNRIIYKSRGRVMAGSMAGLIEGRIRPPRDNNRETQNIEQFLLLKTRAHAKPVVRVRYRREAYESFVNKNVRMTFDRGLACNVTQEIDVGLDGSGWEPVLRRGVIMEIKFTGRFPPWMTRMIRYFDIEQKSVSKFALSVAQAGHLRYCAPVLAGGAG